MHAVPVHLRRSREIFVIKVILKVCERAARGWAGKFMGMGQSARTVEEVRVRLLGGHLVIDEQAVFDFDLHVLREDGEVGARG